MNIHVKTYFREYSRIFGCSRLSPYSHAMVPFLEYSYEYEANYSSRPTPLSHKQLKQRGADDELEVAARMVVARRQARADRCVPLTRRRLVTPLDSLLVRLRYGAALVGARGLREPKGHAEIVALADLAPHSHKARRPRDLG